MSKHIYYNCDIKDCKEAPVGIKRQTINYMKTTVQTEDRLKTLEVPILNTAEIDLCLKHLQLYENSLTFTGRDDGRLGMIFESAHTRNGEPNA